MRIGCNYWASHAGCRMWELWDEAVVREDLKRLAETGCELLRVFPNWRDFQPIEMRYGHHGAFHDIAMNGARLPNTPCGRAGVDECMLRRFRTLAEIAAENGLKLVVSLVTGWMSGSYFTPPALEKLNPLTDPLARMWEIRFVRCLVRELRDCAAIQMWELGNECNCMGKAEGKSNAWLWSYLVSSAIRLEDDTRPVGSGMHGLMPADPLTSATEWSIQDQGELCDVMTAHPYPHSPSKIAARVDVHNSMRIAFQATVEMLYYSDIAGKPGCVEEIGTFSPSYCAETEKAHFVRNSLYNAWAHGAENFLWWCGFDQRHLAFPPYELSAWERELGLFDPAFKPKPVAGELKAFHDFQKKLPFEKLPPFRRDAVCLVGRSQGCENALTNSWSAFLLAKQNHFDLRFSYVGDELPDAPVYLLPGLSGADGIYGNEFNAVLEKVRNGATLYLSLNDGALAPFEEVFGVEVAGREMRTEPARVEMNGNSFELPSPYRLYLRGIRAEILACEEGGNPVFVRSRYGKGIMYLLTLPLELDLGQRPGAFDRIDEPRWREFYGVFAEEIVSRRLIRTDNPFVTLTEHFVDGDNCLVVAVNNAPEPFPMVFEVNAGWRIDAAMDEDKIPPHTGTVLKLSRRMS